MILKKIFLLVAVIFIFLFFPVSAYADNTYNSNDSSESVSTEIENSSSISFPFTFLGNSYTFNIPFSDNFMPIARDIIFYFLLLKSLFTKFKAIPSLLSSVPFIGPSDQSPNESYRVYYNKSSGLFSIFKR